MGAVHTAGSIFGSHTPRAAGYAWASESGHFFVLRSIGDGGYKESGRGRYRQALDVYVALAEAHRAEHLRRGERPEPDAFLQNKGQRG